MDLIGYLISLKRVFVSGGLGKSGFEGEFSANYSNAVMILNRLPKLDFSLRGLVNSLIVLLSNDYCVIAVIFLAKQNFFVTLESLIVFVDIFVLDGKLLTVIFTKNTSLDVEIFIGTHPEK